MSKRTSTSFNVKTIESSTSKVYVAISKRPIQYDVQHVSRQFKAPPVRHQCISIQFVMTHHHVNIKRNFKAESNDSSEAEAITQPAK